MKDKKSSGIYIPAKVCENCKKLQLENTKLRNRLSIIKAQADLQFV